MDGFDNQPASSTDENLKHVTCLSVCVYYVLLQLINDTKK